MSLADFVSATPYAFGDAFYELFLGYEAVDKDYCWQFPPSADQMHSLLGNNPSTHNLPVLMLVVSNYLRDYTSYRDSSKDCEPAIRGVKLIGYVLHHLQSSPGGRADMLLQLDDTSLPNMSSPALNSTLPVKDNQGEVNVLVLDYFNVSVLYFLGQSSAGLGVALSLQSALLDILLVMTSSVLYEEYCLSSPNAHESASASAAMESIPSPLPMRLIRLLTADYGQSPDTLRRDDSVGALPLIRSLLHLACIHPDALSTMHVAPTTSWSSWAVGVILRRPSTSAATSTSTSSSSFTAVDRLHLALKARAVLLTCWSSPTPPLASLWINALQQLQSETSLLSSIYDTLAASSSVGMKSWWRGNWNKELEAVGVACRDPQQHWQESSVLFCYLCLVHLPSFHNVIISRVNLDQLLLLLLDVLLEAYDASKAALLTPQSSSNTAISSSSQNSTSTDSKHSHSSSLLRPHGRVYALISVVLACLMRLSEDEDFVEAANGLEVDIPPSWKAMQRLGRQSTLTNVILLGLMRVIVVECSLESMEGREVEETVLSSSIGALANMLSSAKQVHAHVAERLIQMAVRIAHKDPAVAPLSSQWTRPLMEGVHAVMVRHPSQNPGSLYALLQCYEQLEVFRQDQRLWDLIGNIAQVSAILRARIDVEFEGKGSVSWASSEAAMKSISLFAKTLNFTGLLSIPPPHFLYQEDPHPSRFFCPYLWALTLESCPLAWEFDAIRLFDFPYGSSL
jgi:hypothetical protein